jgi:hypothetical protein
MPPVWQRLIRLFAKVVIVQSYSSLQMGAPAPARADSRRRSLSVGDTREAWPALVAGAPTGSHASENRYKPFENNLPKSLVQEVSYKRICLSQQPESSTALKSFDLFKLRNDFGTFAIRQIF